MAVPADIMAFRFNVRGSVDPKKWLKDHGYADALKWRSGVQNSQIFYSRATGPEGLKESEEDAGVVVVRKGGGGKDVDTGIRWPGQKNAEGKMNDQEIRSKYLDYVSYFRKTNPGQQPITLEDWMRIPEKDRPGWSSHCEFFSDQRIFNRSRI